MKILIVVLAVFASAPAVISAKTAAHIGKNAKKRILIDRDRLEAQLEFDEGKRLIVYRDSHGFSTVGIGHRVTAKDGFFVGDTITEERCRNF